MLLTRLLKPAFLVVLAVACVLAATGMAMHAQRSSADHAFDDLLATQETLVAVAEQELAVLGYGQRRLDAQVVAYLDGRRHYRAVFDEQLRHSHGDAESAEIALLHAEDRLVQRWQRLADRTIAELRADPRARDRFIAERVQVLNGVREANQRVQERIVDEHHEAQDRAAVRTYLVLAVTGLLFGGGGLLLVARSRRLAARRREDAERQARSQALFREVLQLAPNEGEAHRVIGEHLEHQLPGDADVAVMRRNNSHDRLEVVAASGGGGLELPRGSEHPMECLAMKLNRRHDGLDGPGYLRCDLCGKAPGETSCSPVLVAGEVIGSIVVHTPERLSELEQARVAETIDQAAPVLANLRNLAVAETRAATDALTGLPNRRAISEHLHRMVAHAGRTVTPLAALMLDLDHFKQVNDLYGHEQGDAVLAAIASVLRSSLRASDFAGRSGGEEFVVLLPDTEEEGAREVAEKLRREIEGLHLPPLERAVTASFGVAVYPHHAVDAEMLLRSADRALYAAKRSGRNRVELVAPVRP